MQNQLKLNRSGHMEFGGCDTVELAKKFGTPLYVLDEAMVRHSCQTYREGFEAYPGAVHFFYAGKAFLVKAMCRLLAQEGFGLDVVSGGELYTALAAGFPAAKISFNGNNKTADELKQALDAGVGQIIVDNRDELLHLNSLARRRHCRVPILLRLAPGVEAHTHSYIQTGQLDSKFGFTLAGGQAYSVCREALTLDGVSLKGLHCHIGSQIFSPEPYRVAIGIVLDVARRLQEETGWEMEELNVGGGLGIHYTAADNPPTVAEFAAVVSEAVVTEAGARGMRLPALALEPGRSIVGEAGITLYTVGAVKEIPGIRKYVAVDGGMGDNLRPALYGAEYRCVAANKADAATTEVVTVVGRYCESGDVLVRDVALPPVASGDVLAVLSTGAYHHSMASNYNRIGRPAMVLVSNGRAELIVRRENYADLVRHDTMPSWLAAEETASQAK